MVAEKPLISVIIPVYNGEKYIKRCLQSIQNQTYTNLQIIVVNDGSTDHTLDICETLAMQDRRIQIVSQENSGSSAARNEGIRLAKGSLLGFVDADDWINSRMYEELFQGMIAANADIAECGRQFVYDDFVLESDEGTKNIKIYTQREYMKRFFKIESNDTLYYMCSRLYKKDLIEDDLFPVEFSIGEDVISSYKALRKAEIIAVIKEPLYYYFQHDESISAKFDERIFSLEAVWTQMESLAKTDGLNYEEWVSLNKKRIPFTILMQIIVRGNGRNRVYRRQIDRLRKHLKENRQELLKSSIAKNRKIGIILLCCFYNPISVAFEWKLKIKGRR